MAIDAGTVMAYLDMDTSKYTNALQMAQAQATAFAEEGTGLSGMINGFGAGLSTVGRAMTMGVTLPLVGAGVSVTKWAGDFQVSSNKVATIADQTVMSMDALDKGTLAISNRTGILASEINEALYQTISATNDTANALAYTEIAAKAAKGGFTDTATAINGLTTVMNAYGYKGEDAMQRVSDQMLMAQNYGKTTFGEMAAYIGQVIPIAAQLNVGTDELFGSIAALTKQGIGTQQSVTGLKAAYSNIIKPTDEASKVAKALGLDFSAAALESKGWAGFLQDVADKTGGSTEIMAQLFGSVEALNTIMALTSEQGLQELLNGIEAVGESAGATDAAYATMMSGLNAGLEKLKISSMNFGIGIGNFILPYAEKFVVWMQKSVEWLDGLSNSTKRYLVIAGGIAAAIGPALLVGGKLISAFSGVIPMLGMLGAGFAMVYGHSDRLQGFVQHIQQNVPVWMDGLKTGFTAYQEAVANGQSTIDAIGIGMEAAFGSKAAANISGMLRAVLSGFRAARGYITSAMIGVGEFIGSLIDGEGAAEAMRQALEITFGREFAIRAEGAIVRIDSALQTTKTTALQFAQSARETFAGLWVDVQEDYETGGFIGVLEGLGSAVHEAMLQGASAAREGAAYLRDKIGEGLSFTGDWIKSKVLGDGYTPDSSWNAVGGSIWTTIKGGFITTGDWIKGLVLGNGYTPDSSWADAGGSIWTAIKSGFITTGDWIKGLVLGNSYTPDASWSEVGVAILDKIKWAKDTLTEKAGEWLNNLGAALSSDEAKAKVTEITGVVATIAGKIVSGVGAWKTTAATLISDLIVQLTDSEFLQTAITGLGGIVIEIAKGIGAAAVNITGCAAKLITTLSNKFAETGFIESVFTTGADIVLSIAGALASAAGNMASAASQLATGLINGFSKLDWKTIFTKAGEIVGSIAKVLSENASQITTAALDLGLQLLEGLAGVDWATISYNLSVALGNMVTAISNWFAEPANTQTLNDVGGEIAGGIFDGLWQSFLNDIKTGFEKDPILNAIKELFNPKVASIEIVAENVSNDIVPTGGSMGRSFGDAVNEGVSDSINIWQVAGNAAQTAIDTVSQIMIANRDKPKESSQAVTAAMLTPFEELPEDTKAQAALVLVGVGKAIEQGTPEAVAAIELAANAVFDKAKEILSSQAGIAVGSVFITGILIGALGVQGAFVSTIQGIGALGVNAIAQAMNASSGYGIGQSIVQAVISGSGSMASALASRMYGLGLSAVSAFKSAIQMQSPPKAFTDIGEAIPDAVGLGTDKNRDAAINPMLDLARDMQSAFSVSLHEDIVTSKPHTTGAGNASSDAGGNHFEFNFYGDINVREDGDVERIAHLLYQEVSDSIRGGGQLA